MGPSPRTLDERRHGLDLDLAELERMLDEFYVLWGWSRDGIPTSERLRALGLEFAIPSE